MWRGVLFGRNSATACPRLIRPFTFELTWRYIYYINSNLGVGRDVGVSLKKPLALGGERNTTGVESTQNATRAAQV